MDTVIAIFTRLAGVAMIAASIFSLTGCDPGSAFFSSGIQLRLASSGEIEVAVCDAVHINKATGDVFRKTTGKWSRFWDAVGDAEVASGDSGTISQSPFGLSETIAKPLDVQQGDSISIFLHDYTGNSGANVTFEIDDPRVIQDKWIDIDGTLSVTPCSKVSSAPTQSSVG
jgi:hypothetical protein